LQANKDANRKDAVYTSMTAQAFVDLMSNSGVEMTPDKRLQVRRQIKEAIIEGRLILIEVSKAVIGFFTFQKRSDGIFINNLFIVENFRNSKNMLHIRKLFRDRFPDVKKFFWKNRKHNRETSFK
jgi:hypothetical protein